MNDSASPKEDVTVLKCMITVTNDGSGFTAKYNPEIIPVYQHNTHVHFKIDPKSSDDVEIDSVAIKPDGQTQLVDEQFSSDRKIFKLKDLNTIKGTFNLKFTYKDKNGAKIDSTMLKCGDMGIEVPEIDNNPPG